MSQCMSCHFYDRNGARAADGRSLQWGLCRRAAPQLHPVSTKAHMIEGVWPTVRDDDWCGQWQAQQGKVSDVASAGAAASPHAQPQPRVAPAFSSPRALPSHGGAAAIAAGYKPTASKALK